MSAEVACSFYAEFAINGTKQTADTHAIVGLNRFRNSIFTLRLGGKKIIKYSLALLSDREKLEFLSDFYDSIVNHEFDTEILNFISQQIENAEKRKKISNERRKLKKQQEKEEATKRTIAAASSLIEETMSQSLPRYAQI